MCLSQRRRPQLPSISFHQGFFDDSSRERTIKNNTRHIIQHVYHDHAHDNMKNLKRKTKGGVKNPFPNRLHKMISDVETCNLQDIVSWAPHGRCFIVHKQRSFVEKILPEYFSQTKIGSFQRQLNLYGFKRLTQGPDKGGYYHELFLRGVPDLCNKMNRTRVKGTRIRGCSNPESEPNFYEMPPIEDTKEDHDHIASFCGKTFHLLNPPMKELPGELWSLEANLEEIRPKSEIRTTYSPQKYEKKKRSIHISRSNSAMVSDSSLSSEDSLGNNSMETTDVSDNMEVTMWCAV